MLRRVFNKFLGLAILVGFASGVANGQGCPAGATSVTGFTNLSSGTVYCVDVAGDVTFNLSGGGTGTEVYITTNVTSFSGQMQNFQGTLYNYSDNFSINNWGNVSGTVEVHNYGYMEETSGGFGNINGTLILNNYEGGEMDLNSLNNLSSSFTLARNEGTINFNNLNNFNGAPTMVNQGFLNFANNINYSGDLTNEGLITAEGNITLNTGTIENLCGIYSKGSSFQVNNNTFTNDGLIIVEGDFRTNVSIFANSSDEGFLSINGTISGGQDITGDGRYWIGGFNSWNGTIGVGTGDNFSYNYATAPNVSKLVGGSLDASIGAATDADFPSTCSSIIQPSSNAAPDPDDIAESMDEDGVLNSSIAAEMTDPDGHDVAITSPGTITADHGTVVMSANGDYTYTPDENYNGTDEFTFEICDDTIPSLCASATVTITIAPINDNPSIIDNRIIPVTEETPTSVLVLANDNDDNDYDPVGTTAPDINGLDASTLTIVTPPLHADGTPTVNTTSGQITYTPVENYIGLDSLEYEVCDLGIPTPAKCGTAWVVYNVINTNDEPEVPNTTENGIIEDIVFTVTDVADGVLANATDPDGDVLSVTSTTVPTAEGGSVTFNSNGTYSYSPPTDYHGDDQVDFSVSDGNGGEVTATLNLEIQAVNDDPVVVNNTVNGVLEDAASVVVDVLANDNDNKDIDTRFASGELGGLDPSSVSVTIEPSNGSITDINTSTGEITYVPDANFFGTETFTYEVCDIGYPTPVKCGTAIVTINIAGENDEPETNRDAVGDVIEDIPYTSTISVLDNDSDNDVADDLEVTTGTTNTILNGTITFDADGTFTYAGPSDFHGVDSVEYTVDDGTVSVTEWLVITVAPINDFPVTSANDATTDEDTPVDIETTSNDAKDLKFAPFGGIDDGSLSVTIQPSNGSTSVNTSTGVITYTPDDDFNGTDEFTYEICDVGYPTPVECVTEVVVITIDPVNDLPDVPTQSEGTTIEDQTGNFTVSATDTEGDALFIETSGLSDNGGTVTTSGLDITYIPDEHFYGTDTIELSVCDAANSCVDTYFPINVTAVNDEPVVNDISGSTAEATPATWNILIDGINANDVIDNDPKTGNANSAIDLGTLTFLPGSSTADISHVSTDLVGNITYSPPLGLNNVVRTISYQVCDDGYGESPFDDTLCTIGVISINISADAPNARDSSIADGVWEDSVLTLELSSLVTDPQGIGTIVSYEIVGSVLIGTIDLDETTGALLYQGDLDEYGTETFTYEVVDEDGYSSQGTITFPVKPVNDDPIAGDNQGTTSEDNDVMIRVLGNDNDNKDPEGGIDNTTLAVIEQPTNGTASIVNDSVLYTPNQNFFGFDTVTYEVCDLGYGLAPYDESLCATAIVVIEVTGRNDIPVSNADTLDGILEDEFGVINVLVNDNDSSDVNAGNPNGGLDLTSLSSAVDPEFGIISIDNTTGDITYTPNEDFNGNDEFVYTICDFDGACVNDTVFVTVDPVGDDPIATDTIRRNVPEETLVSMDIIALSGTNDQKDIINGFAGGFNLDSLKITSNPSNGSSTITGGNITYEPNSNFNGMDTLTYTICDNGFPEIGCVDGIIIVTINGENDAPFAEPDFVETLEDSTLTVSIGQIIANDSDSLDPGSSLDTNSFSIIEDPSLGTIEILDGIITYTPNPNLNGADTVVYEICDEGGLCVQDTIFIDLQAVNDPVTALPINRQVDEDASVTISLMDFVNDDQDFLFSGGTQGGINIDSIQLINPPSTIIWNSADSTIIATPLANSIDSIIVDYLVCDLGYPLPATCDTATITIKVNSTPDSPNVETITISTLEDSSYTFDPTDYADDDLDGGVIDPATFDASTTNLGTFKLDSLNMIVFTPYDNMFGSDTITYSIADATGESASSIIYIDVIPVNDKPIVSPDTSLVNVVEDVTNINIITNVFDTLLYSDDIDNEGEFELSSLDSSSFVIVADPEFGSLNVNYETGQIRYSPITNYYGYDKLVYQLCDAPATHAPYGDESQLCDTGVVVIFVEPVNDAPVIVPNDSVPPSDPTEFDSTSHSTGILYYTTFMNTVLEECATMYDIDGDQTYLFVNYDYNDGDDQDGVIEIQVPTEGCFNYTPPTNYVGFDTVQVLVEDGNLATEVLIVIEIRPTTVTIPEGTSPNSTPGINDTWEIENIEEFPENKMQIFNRWGNLVWSAENYDNYDVVWDGTSNVGGTSIGDQLPTATYFYVLEVTVNDEVQYYKGFVVLK